jgi:predicted nucleic acid-binding protein
MSGTDFLIDTNILVYIVQGNPRVQYFAKEDTLTISCISEVEMLGRFQISSEEKEVITQMLSYCNIVDLNSHIKQLAIELKQKYRIKLPDALIAATAMQQNLTLVTADKGFRKISELDLLLITL